MRGAEKIGEGFGEEPVTMTSPVGIVRQVNIGNPVNDRFGEDFVGTRNWQRRIFCDFSNEVDRGILWALEIRGVGRGFVRSNKEDELGVAIALDGFLKNRNPAPKIVEIGCFEIFFSGFVEIHEKIAVIRGAEEARLGEWDFDDLIVQAEMALNDGAEVAEDMVGIEPGLEAGRLVEHRKAGRFCTGEKLGRRGRWRGV